MFPPNPYWIAPRKGHDWTDPEVLAAVEWLSTFAGSSALSHRLAAQEERFYQTISMRQKGKAAECSDSRDQVAWYLLQGRSFATDRKIFDYDQVCEIVPYLKRLGLDLSLLKTIQGVEDRAARLMTQERSQPDSGIFEFLVAIAYAKAGWNVKFVPETPGQSKQPDLHVWRPRTRWAVECKRLQKSSYEKDERLEGQRIAQSFHEWCRKTRSSMVADVIFKRELKDIPSELLVNAYKRGVDAKFVKGRFFTDANADVRFRNIHWPSVHRVLSIDDVFYGSSRMIEILKGEHQLNAVHSMSAEWKPSTSRPAFAEWIDQASVVSWWSDSNDAKKKRVRHFKQTLQKAEEQLPADRPGIVHIGCPGQFDNDVEGLRHFHNWLHLCDFRTTHSRLRWVNAYLLKPEPTTDPNETWAFQETLLPYKVGRHNTQNPMPDQLMVVELEQNIPSKF